MLPSLAKSTIAEFLGTFVLALVVATLMLNQGASGYLNLFLPLGIAITYGVLTYCLQRLSGANLNPCVSLGLWVVKQLPLRALIAYAVAQLVGAYLGFSLAHYFSGAPLVVPDGTSLRAELAELFGALIVCFAMAQISFGQINPGAVGLVSGGALLIALSIAQVASGGIVNPALAIGMGDYHLSYILMPLIGGVIGSLIARSLRLIP